MRKFVLLLWCVVAAVQIAKAEDPLETLAKQKAQLSLTLAELDQVQLKFSFESLERTEKGLDLLSIVAAGVSNEKTKDSALELLDAADGLLKLGCVGLPLRYEEEIIPLVFDNLRGKPLPKKPTAVQQRILKAAKNATFAEMMAEIREVMAEDRKVFEAESFALNIKIQALKKLLGK